MITRNTKTLIPKSWDMPDNFKRRIGAEVGRQRLIQEDQHILLVLHKVPQLDDDGKREASLFWRNEDGEWKSLCEGGGLDALKRHLEHYRETAHILDEHLDAATEAADYFKILRQVKPLLRITIKGQTFYNPDLL